MTKVRDFMLETELEDTVRRCLTRLDHLDFALTAG